MKKKLPEALKPYQFKPGMSGNPEGAKPKTPEERRLLRLTRNDVAGLLNKVSGMTVEELQTKFNDPQTNAIERLFIKTVVDGLKGDSVRAAEFILSRIVGRPSENLQITSLKRVVKKLDGTEVHYTNDADEE